MNRHKNGRKTVVFRIFSELHAKMSLGALCLCGFPGDSVEMVRARGRALTRFFTTLKIAKLLCRNGESPRKGIDTIFSRFLAITSLSVEMVRARGRALTLPSNDFSSTISFVEMVRARGRALTQLMLKALIKSV